MVFAQVVDFFNFFDLFTIMFIVVAIIILIVFIVIIYFIIRAFSGGTKRSERMSPAKPYPENVYKREETSKFCTYCGAKITEELVICPKCGEQLN